MQRSEKERRRKLKDEDMKEMKRRKLDIEQTIETLKKSLCRDAIAPAQQNGQSYATKAAKTLKEKMFYHEFCGL